MPETYDKDAYLDAIQPSVFIADGQTYESIICSADEWFALRRRLVNAPDDDAAQVQLIRYVFNLLFPPPPRWMRWVGLAQSAADHVAQLPFAEQLEAFQRFLQAQAAIQNGTPLRATTSPTDGSSSPS